MNNGLLIWVIFVIGAVQYLMKAAPLVFIKEKVKNKFLSSFLFYIPYAVLTCMVIPEVFGSTSSSVSAAAGAAAAIILGLFNQGLLVVSLSATAVVFIVEKIMNIF
jgi:branched-subunit amino acid transport protein